jgi:hypothetical protein
MKPDSSPGRQPRLRVASVLNRPGEMASPLAQLFQPLVVDEVIPENSQPYPGTQDGVSYGPVSRRRLSSATTLQKMVLSGQDSENVAGQSWAEQREASLEPETAGETEEKESTLGNLEWARRLDSIEERQKRIENLLYEVLRGMRGGDIYEGEGDM